MNLKDSLIRKGYFPENLPPSFTTAGIADYFQNNPPEDYYSTQRNAKPFQAANYNSSKRGKSRRIFSVIHPATAYDLAEFVTEHWVWLKIHYISNSDFSLSVPQRKTNAERAIVISSYRTVEHEKFSRLSPYRFIVTTDIARFYHSIYTHAIPWAYHGKDEAKSDHDPNSGNVLFNKADLILRNGQDGQTIGIPVGPDVSRVFAELIGTAIDAEFKERMGGVDYAALRYVDDVWIGVNSHADAEKALSYYQSAVRSFELDINENKTGIFSEDFRFLDLWPGEIKKQFEQISEKDDRFATDTLRAALENSFRMAVERNDEGVLKFTLVQIDRLGLNNEYWEVVEPFLQRVSIHFGHTIEYVVKILVFRHSKGGELEENNWNPILVKILRYHANLGHDKEVCWLIYLYQKLDWKFEGDVAESIAETIVDNCGAMALVALLNYAESNWINSDIYNKARERICSESVRSGRFWPVFLEWNSRQWPGYDQLEIDDEIIQDLSKHETVIYDQSKSTRVSEDIG